MGLFNKNKSTTSSSSGVYVPGASNSNTSSNVNYTANMPAPKKYTKVNGVMKLNPEYKRWTDAQNSAGAGGGGGGGVLVPTTYVANIDNCP